MSDKKEFSLAVIIGRFQPFHNGHEYMINEAYKIATDVLVLVGSANESLTERNPFTYTQRRSLILMNTPKEFIHSIRIEPLNDHAKDEDWVNQIRDEISRIAKVTETVIVGHKKDKNTAVYLDTLMEFYSHYVDNFENINATDIRKDLYSHELYKSSKVISHHTMRAINYWLPIDQTLPI